MKQKDIFEELIELSRQIGITVRREKGNFKSGHCFIDDKELFVLNKSTPIESLTAILAQGLLGHADKMYLKPVIRDFIEKEKTSVENSFRLDVNY